MCLTLPGRIQTRAVTLINVLILAILFASLTKNLGYFTMFFLMVVVALPLDLFVYSKLIQFQPRWLTILLGIGEFFILFLFAPQPVTLLQMAVFYIPAWLAGWLTMEILLPLAWPRWAEDGGEFRSLGKS